METKLDLDSVPTWYFGLMGLGIEGQTCAFIRDLAEIRHVAKPPSPPELLLALDDTGLFGPLVRYCGMLKYELLIHRRGTTNAQHCFTIAQTVINAIRVRTNASFLVPAAADCSWSSFERGSTTHVELIEDFPHAYIPGHATVSTSQIEWVDKYIFPFAHLLNDERFSLAVDALCSYQLQVNHSMKLAMLWSGIEALFGFNQELRFRLSVALAAFLCDRGPERQRMYKTVKALYDARSKAVHGAKKSTSDTREPIGSTAHILSESLCKITELGHVPAEGEIEDAVFL